MEERERKRERERERDGGGGVLPECYDVDRIELGTESTLEMRIQLLQK